MVKQGPSALRIAVMAGFALSCFGLLLFLWLAFGGAIPLKPKGYRINASFAEATQLAVEADVRISGVPVGKVKTIEPDRKSGRSEVVIQLDEDYAPLPRDSKAILRQKTLLGETYVELTPGTKRPGNFIEEDGRLAETQIGDTVELDEIFRAFDEPTRRAFQDWIVSQERALRGRSRDINAALANLGPFAEDLSVLVRILNNQEGAVRGTIRDTGVVFEALTERDGQLADMITNLNDVFETTAARDRDLQDVFRVLPTFSRESRTTLARLDRFARDTDPLVTQLRPAARELSPTLTDLSALAPDLRLFFRDFDRLITASVRGFPAAERVLEDIVPLLRQVDPALSQLIPITDFLGLYKRELTSFFANTVAATQSQDIAPESGKRVHYLRTTNPLNPENLAVYPRRIGSNRPNPYVMPNHFDQLSAGLPVFEDRHCGRGVPVVSQVVEPVLSTLVPQALIDQINQFAFPVTSQGQTPAPPCKKQGPFTIQGETSDYPHVKAQP